MTNYLPTPIKSFLAATLLALVFPCYAIDSKTIEQQAGASIKELYHTLSVMPNISMPERIEWFSGQFKGVNYILGSLGEGPDARYDQYPKYRVDGFDCDTYVNTVLALALANSFNTFKQCLEYSRYLNGKVSYINRNHFTSIDWNANNQRRKMLKDITLNIKNKQNKPVALYAEALINKAGWYAHKKLDTIRLQKENKNEQEKRLAELKKKGGRLNTTLSKIPYIPLTSLFPNGEEPDLYLFSQIPTGSIIEIVRPNWDLRQAIGTSLNISHLGFAIRINDQLYFRQASSQFGKVIDVPLADYLRDALKSPTIKGINVQIVVPEKPITGNCSSFNIKK